MYNSLTKDQLNKEIAKLQAIKQPSKDDKANLVKAKQALQSLNSSAIQAVKDMQEDGIKFSEKEVFDIPLPEVSSGNGGGKSSIIIKWFADNPGKGLTTSEARKILFANIDSDPSGTRTRKAIRDAQGKQRLQGLVTARLRYGNNKRYHSVKPEQVEALKAQAESQGYTFEQITAGN